MKENFKDFKERLRRSRVAVLGIGVSNQPLIRYIANLGAEVTACDKKGREYIGDICSEFESMGVELRFGEKYLEGMDQFDIIFRSPSLRPDLPELLKAAEKGAYITSEIEEFVRYCPAQVIGITGSDGKTTTASIVYEMLKQEGYTAWLGGNIGYPLFDRLDDIGSGDKVVLELSSFQLMDMDVCPDISVITNLSPNHLDIHKSMKEYVESKKNIFKFQDGNGLLILNLDNDITRSMEAEAQGHVTFFSRLKELRDGAYLRGRSLVVSREGIEHAVCSMEEVRLPGLHNIENLLAAFAAVMNICSIESMRSVAVTFTGVEHRIEFVRELGGVKYYNDSIASSPTRTAAGLKSFDRKVILIAGGYDKKIPFEELAHAGVDKVKLLILIGATAQKIHAAFDSEMDKKGIEVPVLHAQSLEEAVASARGEAVPGDIVILSPACASFDMFKNFEVRGNRFKEIVNKL
jgi:UDP-N-acetylmuramoylalanine--D-glutamate ligase